MPTVEKDWKKLKTTRIVLSLNDVEMSVYVIIQT